MKTNSSRKVIAPLILVTSLILSLIPVFSSVGTIKASPVTIFSDDFSTAIDSASQYDSWFGGATAWAALSSTTGGPKQGAGRLGLLESGASPYPWIKTPSFATTGYENIKISFKWTMELNNPRHGDFWAEWSTDNSTFIRIEGTTFNDNYTSPTVLTDLPVSSNDNVANKPNLWIRWWDNLETVGSGSRDKVSFDDVVITGVLSGGGGPGVDVSISPSENSGAPETILTYTVVVKNIGASADNYILTQIDNENWGPTLDDNLFLNVGSGDNRTTTLRVTVPVDAANGAQDLITVTATSQGNGSVTDNGTCISISFIVPPVLFSASISPSSQTALPGDNLVYTFMVNNNGAITDNYNLVVGDDAVPSWGPTLDDNLFLNVGSGDNRTTTLRVTVPVDAANGAQDLITVTATSQENENIMDNEICKAVCLQTPPPSENFTIVALPDTQKYSAYYPAIFDNQTNWIVQNENKENIVFVTHLGDIVDTANSVTQWTNADTAMRILDNEVLYGILPGNHDLQDGGTKYSSYFPPSRYSYWDGSYVSYGPSNNLNNYQLFSFGGMNFIALDLEYDPPADVLTWAGNVLDNYSNRRAIISTHAYLTPFGNWSGNGQAIYDSLVVPHNNVFLVLCGHSYGSNGYGVWKRIDNFDGRMAYGLLSDYQNMGQGGDGYLRIMKFVPSENTIHVKTYSPWLNNYWTDDNNQFELYYPMPAARSVSVSITPSDKYGITGDNLTYDVTVTNTGYSTDNYTLNLTDTLGWTNGGLPATIGPIAAGDDWTGQIWVVVGGTPGIDNLTVTATSVGNLLVSGSDTGYAHFVLKGVIVSITPGTQNGLPGDNLTYTVTVQNVGVSGDNYDVTVNDAMGWGATVDDSVLAVPVHENRTTTLRVTISLSAVIGQADTLTVTATSQSDITIKDNYSATAIYPIVRTVDVSVSPSDKYGWTGENLVFDVTVKNTGNVSDNYQLSLTDTLLWPAGLNAPSQVLGNVYFKTDNYFKDSQDVYIRENSPDNNFGGRYNMYVGTENNTGVVAMQRENLYTKWDLSKLPAGAVIDNAYMWLMGRYGPSHTPGNISDNIWVEAWTVTDDTWNENTMTWATGGPAMASLLDNVHWIASYWANPYKWYKWNVTSWIQNQYTVNNVASIGMKSNGIGDNGIFGGCNGWFYQKDNYLYSGYNYNAPWMQVSYHLVANTPNTVSLGPGENWTGTFWVVLNGIGTDEMTVTATSMTNGSVTANATAQANSTEAPVCGVDVTIDPWLEDVYPSQVLEYTINVQNTGIFTDNYLLSVLPGDWPDIVLADNVLTNVAPGDNASTQMFVHVPDGAEPCTYEYITVVAESQLCGATGNGTTIAHVIEAPPPVTGTASIRLATGSPPSPPYLWGIRKVKVTTSLVVNIGDNLRLIFLANDNVTLETEAVIWSRTAPGAENVILTNLVVPHDSGSPYPTGQVKRVKLVLTDSAGNIILDNMAWFRAVQDDWGTRITWIILNWASHNSSQQDQLGSEISTIVLNWASCPTGRDQGDFSQS